MKLRPRQIAAIVTALLFLAGAYLLYRGDFVSLRTEERQIQAIIDYASANPENPDSLRMRMVLHPVVQFDQTFGNHRILVFTDSETGGLLGRIQFRRGIFGGWQPLSAFYTVGAVMQSATIRDQDIRMVYAVDCPPEIAHYKVQADLNNDTSLMAEGDVTESKFFHIYETDRNYFPAIWLFDEQGNQLDETLYLASNQNYPSPSIGSAEINAVYWFCAILLGIGWLIVKYIWDGGKPRPDAKST